MVPRTSATRRGRTMANSTAAAPLWDPLSCLDTSSSDERRDDGAGRHRGAGWDLHAPACRAERHRRGEAGPERGEVRADLAARRAGGGCVAAGGEEPARDRARERVARQPREADPDGRRRRELEVSPADGAAGPRGIEERAREEPGGEPRERGGDPSGEGAVAERRRGDGDGERVRNAVARDVRDGR